MHASCTASTCRRSRPEFPVRRRLRRRRLSPLQMSCHSEGAARRICFSQCKSRSFATLRMTRIISAFLLAVAALLASAQAFADLASSYSPSRHQRLVETARKEGSVTVYTSNAAETIKVLSADFEKRYGVRVNAWRASSAKVLQRM